MRTAQAITNQVGHTVGAYNDMGVQCCRIDQFKVDSRIHGSMPFPFESKMKWVDMKKPCVLGDYLTGDHRELELIAQQLTDAGVNLREPVSVWGIKEKSHVKFELWTERKRWRVINGRVYGHARMNRSG